MSEREKKYFEGRTKVYRDGEDEGTDKAEADNGVGGRGEISPS